MSGKDERPNRDGGGHWSAPTIEYYREKIQHVLTWMDDSDLNFELGYTLIELEGFVLMSGVMGPFRWVERIARGVKREIDRVLEVNDDVR